jgi:hypothetical protein
MKIMKAVLPALILAGGFFALTSSVSAKPEYSKKEKVNCITCHVKMGSKDLNDTGKKYKETGKLEKK